MHLSTGIDATRVQGVANHGIIQSLEMHQFMCHKRLSFQFGPQVNFIIGMPRPLPSFVLPGLAISLARSQRKYVFILFIHNGLSGLLILNPGGKSAVLSAITVALGGKATSTGRGAGLKAFIREGQS